MRTHQIILSVFLVLCIILPSFGQPGAPPATPIDGGLGLMLLAGGALGVKRILRKPKS